jgi:hypothetical protein
MIFFLKNWRYFFTFNFETTRWKKGKKKLTTHHLLIVVLNHHHHHVNHPLPCEDVNRPEIAREEFENIHAIHAENDGNFIERTEENERQSTRVYFGSLDCDCQHEFGEIQSLGKANGIPVRVRF